MRIATLGAVTALACLGSGGLRAQTPRWRQVSVSVTTCSMADSLLGPLIGKPHRIPALQAPDSAPLILIVSSEQVNQGLREPSLRLTVHASSQPQPTPPFGELSFLVTGEAARRLLATREAPPLSLELADSIVITPSPVSLGTYDGPPSFATAPVGAHLAANSLLAVVRSDSLVARLGLLSLRPSPSFREKARAAYRIATCGYGHL